MSDRRAESGGRWWQRAFAPVDIASLVAFRIAFGAIMVWEVCRYFQHDWITSKFIQPRFHFHYWGFEFVQPWTGGGMYSHFLGLGLLAVGLLLGAYYRICAVLFWLCFTYVFLIDQAEYLNHFYLLCLISFLMIFVPAHRALSVDAALRRPALRSRTIPAWSLWLLQAQVGIVYFYGGIAKLNSDWIRGEPVRQWLLERLQASWTSALLPAEQLVCLIAWGGILFDLLIAPLLLWRRTRPVAFLVAVGFHVSNAHLFSIGIFPWFMIAATTLFLSPAWPRDLLRRLRGLPVVTPPTTALAAPVSTSRQKLVLTLCGVYLTMQVLMPLRHWAYPGDVNWTEEGHLFSWRMKLRSKRGTARFFVNDPSTGTTTEADLAQYLSPRQIRKMVGRPDMILQFAHYLADQHSATKPSDVTVHALVSVSLNGHEPRLLVDPQANLAACRRTLHPADWILRHDALQKDVVVADDVTAQMVMSRSPCAAVSAVVQSRVKARPHCD